MAIPSSRGMLNRASRSSPSPLQRDRSWIEYFDEKSAWVIRSRRESATVPDSSALRGSKPQQAMAKMIASNIGSKSSSKGQLMKTDFNGSVLVFVLAADLPAFFFTTFAT